MVFLKALKNKKEFDLLHRKGKPINGKLFYLKHLESSFTNDPCRSAIIVSTKISKKATERNRKRRQLKEIIRLNRDKIKKGTVMIVVAKEGVLEASYQDLEREFLEIMRKGRLLGE